VRRRRERPALQQRAEHRILRGALARCRLGARIDRQREVSLEAPLER